jgi:hypothetical protein
MVKYYKKQAYITVGNLYNTLVSNPQGSYLGSKSVTSVPNIHTVGNLYNTLVPNPRGSYLGSQNVPETGRNKQVGGVHVGSHIAHCCQGVRYLHTLGQITIKTSKPKCRLYWCLIEFIDWRYSQSCWYFFDPSCELAPL